ncbi:hypothetical protein SAMN02745247_01464 [Butyrivibrio hungatei DSM 14810]|uniref:Uncharacterized protein n=2 Tax=Butyrivibrio hungatei TaxID=185008 RepID=A0A1D9P1V9_9FIRM|nr:hypothetical protein [Butyrivibrio hungatei]AOZ96576.1 hypothetical protein bhn_I1543 [Butyrivibrio hungatei]SHN55844.1 hypothetical protein SAMN02745247_01464 [Butyrivibrio hungatei DSM 14810]
MKKRGFCIFYKNLYWGSSLKKHSLIKWRLVHGRGQFNIFCITRSMNDRDQLDIIHCAFLKQSYYLEHPVMIYGVAKSYDEALELVVKISDEAIQNGYEGRLLAYLDRE